MAGSNYLAIMTLFSVDLKLNEVGSAIIQT